MRRFRNPWWVHVPILGALVVCAVAPAVTRPWPARARRYTWEDLAMPVALLVLLLVCGVVESEFWAGAENGQKRFNWRLLWLSGLGGWMAGLQVGFFWGRHQGVTWDSTSYGWAGAAICAAGMAILEWVRQPVDSAGAASAWPGVGSEISAASRWMYFTVERARWIRRALIGLLSAAPLFLIVGMSGELHHLGWWLLAYVPMLLPVLFASLVGTLRIQVNSERLVLRSGLGIRLLRVNAAEIFKVDVETVNPLADFGGWGINSRGGVRAFLFGGNRGVRVETRGGKKYLIGCREPERLAKVIRVAARLWEQRAVARGFEK